MHGRAQYVRREKEGEASETGEQRTCTGSGALVIGAYMGVRSKRSIASPNTGTY